MSNVKTVPTSRGAAVESRIICNRSSALRPSSCASADNAMRWRKAATAIDLMSSGTTKERAAISAAALAARTRAIGPREPLPMAIPGQSRVARAMRTA